MAIATCAIPIQVSAQAPTVPGGAAAGPSTTTANKTYDAVVQGMSCKQQPSGRMNCEYRVGKSLHFTVSGVGQQDVVVNFFKVDSSEDYVASVAPLHGCVVVRPTQARGDTTMNLAFVSPQDGKIYRNWNTCAGRKGRD